MKDATSTVLVLVLGLGFTLAGVLFLSTRRTLRARLRSTPRTRVREARAGSRVKLVGRLVAQEPVRAPLANVDCAYFQMFVNEVLEEVKQTTEASFTEKEYAKGLALEDESGRIEVQPEGAEFKYIRVREFSPGGAAWTPEMRHDLIARYVSSRNGRTDSHTYLREERLDLGTPVVALGRVEEGPQGPVLTGGSELELFGETEQELSALKGMDLLAWAVLVMGLVLCGAWAAELVHTPEPIPGTEAVPIQRRGR